MKLVTLVEAGEYESQLRDTIINLLGMAKLNGITKVSLQALQNNLKRDNFDIDDASLIEILSSIPLVTDANVDEISLDPGLAMKKSKKTKDKMKATARKQAVKAIKK